MSTETPGPTASFSPLELTPISPITTTKLCHHNSSRINQYFCRSLLFSTPQTQVYLCDDDEREVVVKAVKRKNATRDKFQLLRRSNQGGNKKLLLSTEQSIFREIAILKASRHANHVQLLEVIDDPARDKVYIVLEYLRGGAVQWQDQNKQPVLTVEQARRIFRDVVVGLEYLHYMGIIHRDIKPDNLVWNEDRSHIRIIDYGISHFSPLRRKVPFARWRKELAPLQDPLLFPPNDVSKLRGTDYFIAPEVVWVPDDQQSAPSAGSSAVVTNESTTSVLSAVPGPSRAASVERPPTPGPAPATTLPPASSRPPITKAIDIWSLGVTLYCFLFGRLPFDVSRIPNQHPTHARFILYAEICTKDWIVPETMGADRQPSGGRHPTDPKSVIRLLDRILHKDPRKRISLAAIKRHPWVLDGLADPTQWISDTSPANYYRPNAYRWILQIFDRMFTQTMKPLGA
ncbi:other/CAMKK/ELM protein kinase [Mycena floridula]|nr:other/CAMKK/ELM protein kinase [Mycena floridula]